MRIILKHLRVYSSTINEPSLNNGAAADFPTNNFNSALFNFKIKTTGRTNNGTKDIKIRVPLKYLSKFWRTL